MIQFVTKWLDVTPNLLTQQQPVFDVLVERERNHAGPRAWAGGSQIARPGEFWVPINGLLEQQIQWSVSRSGEAVRVPVHAYKTDRALASIWGLGVQIGMMAVDALRSKTQDRPLEVTLVIGHDCTDLSPAEDAFRCYIGVAIRTK